MAGSFRNRPLHYAGTGAEMGMRLGPKAQGFTGRVGVAKPQKGPLECGNRQGSARMLGVLLRTRVRSSTGEAGNWGIGGEQTPTSEGGCCVLGSAVPEVRLNSSTLLTAWLCAIPLPAQSPPELLNPLMNLASCGGELRASKNRKQ